MSITGYRIRELRRERKMRQQTLADILQTKYGFVTPYTTISRWEHGKQEPEVSKMKAIAEIFGVSLDYVAGLTDERNGTEKPKHGLIAFNDPTYNPFFDETNEYYGDDVAWRKLHGMIDARPKLEAVVRACMELTDEQLDKILQMIGLMI